MSNVKMMLSHFEKANEDTVMNDYYAVQQSAFLYFYSVPSKSNH